MSSRSTTVYEWFNIFLKLVIVSKLNIKLKSKEHSKFIFNFIIETKIDKSIIGNASYKIRILS